MENRREFFGMAMRNMSAACLLGGALRATEASGQGSERLAAVLAAAGKPCRKLDMPDGTTVVLLPHGGRVLGLFAPGDGANFYWTNPALETVETAQAFLESDAWQNTGGDRTWLAPEVDVFLPDYPDTRAYWQPRALDPGNYAVEEGLSGPRLVNDLTLKLSRKGEAVDLRMAKWVAPAANPMRHEPGLDLPGLRYAGYTQHTRLELRSATGATRSPVGLWNLVQMPHGGDLLIPVFHRSQPKVWFGAIAPEDLEVGDRLIRYRMRAKGEHKLGVRALATTGRVGYLHGSDENAVLIIRSFRVNPSGEYVDVPWKDPDDRGYSTQACNVNSGLGSFSELEYHVPAIGGNTGLTASEDVAQIWAFRGPEASVRAAARILLSPEV